MILDHLSTLEIRIAEAERALGGETTSAARLAAALIRGCAGALAMVRQEVEALRREVAGLRAAMPRPDGPRNPSGFTVTAITTTSGKEQP